MRKKVVIIGHGYTSRLGIIRSLAELDCEIVVIALVSHGFWGRIARFEGLRPIDCCSKYVSRFYYCRADDEEGLVSLLMEKCTYTGQKVIIIPDSDVSAAIIDNNKERLCSCFVFPFIAKKPDRVEYWMDKSVQKGFAQKIGLDVANGCIVQISNHEYVFPSEVSYPCFTKPLASIDGGKRYLKKCEDAVQLRSVLDSIAQKYNTNVLVEDFKTIDKEYAVVGFSDGRNVVIPGIIEFIKNSESHFGIAREGVIKPLDGFERIVNQFRSFVREIGFCGLFDIDFYESNQVLFFGEINLRFGGSGYAVTALGVNLPAMMVKFLSGEPYDDMPQVIHESALYINERMCLDDYVGGYLSKEGLDLLMNDDSKIHFIRNDVDPGPQRRFDRDRAFQVFNRKRRYLIRRFFR